MSIAGILGSSALSFLSQSPQNALQKDQAGVSTTWTRHTVRKFGCGSVGPEDLAAECCSEHSVDFGNFGAR
jgi:hypothetical protein